MRYALKFAYDGSRFDGYARQPDLETVEGSIIKAMIKLGMIEDETAGKFQSSSRTDKGVSAAGNVLTIDTGFKRDAIIPALNSNLENIVFLAISEVPSDFNVRWARQRIYRYFLLDDADRNPVILNETTSIFLGEHDFRNFTKTDAGNDKTRLTIDFFQVSKNESFLVFEIRARNYIWQLVRRLVGATIQLADGDLDVSEVVAALSPGVRERPAIYPVPASGLVLMDVTYNFDFECISPEENTFKKSGENVLVHARVLSELAAILTDCGYKE